MDANIMTINLNTSPSARNVLLKHTLVQTTVKQIPRKNICYITIGYIAISKGALRLLPLQMTVMTTVDLLPR